MHSTQRKLLNSVRYFQYGQTEIEHLSGKDQKLGDVIRRFGMLERRVTPDVFEALVECIVGQQISSKAASTVNQRLKTLLVRIDAGSVLEKSIDEIQQCGMTIKKAQYITKAAEAILDGSINIEAFNTMDDEAIVEQLIRLPGVGRWTVEMILLHALQRPNVFSADDLVIRRSLMSIHELSVLGKTDFESFRQLYSPYGSVAMIYLWKYGAQTR